MCIPDLEPWEVRPPIRMRNTTINATDDSQSMGRMYQCLLCDNMGTNSKER